MKLTLSDLIVPAVIVGALGWWGYNNWSEKSEKNRAEQAQQAESAEYQHAVEAMAARHGATPALTDKLTAGGRIYTYNVQNALLAASGRAVILRGSVVDLEKRDNAYVLHLDDTGAAPTAVIRYVLECDAATAQKIVGPHAPAPGVTVAAVITQVEKAEFENASAAPATATPTAATRFVAKGRCLELVTR